MKKKKKLFFLYVDQGAMRLNTASDSMKSPMGSPPKTTLLTTKMRNLEIEDVKQTNKQKKKPLLMHQIHPRISAYTPQHWVTSTSTPTHPCPTCSATTKQRHNCTRRMTPVSAPCNVPTLISLLAICLLRTHRRLSSKLQFFKIHFWVFIFCFFDL